MKHLTAFILSCIMLILTTTVMAEKPASTDKVNIVLLVADDLGWTDLHCYGSGYYQTPNIDKLCEQGMKFNNAYTCPNCAPTRAALMSGQYSPRTGVYTVASGARGNAGQRKVIPVPNKTTLNTDIVTVAETLRSAGYATASMGKWHLGRPGASGPCEHGFDLNVGGNHSGSPKGGYFGPFRKNPQLPKAPNRKYLTDLLTDEAVKFIEEKKDQPFFLYLPYYAVHTPIQAKNNLTKKYSKIKRAGGHRNPRYAAMVETVDQNVGRILKKIDQLDLTHKTVVVFMSDNGGVGGYASIGHRGNKSPTDNAPLRGGKGCMYEGGVRVPMIVRWPGVTKAGSTCSTPVNVVDFHPTLAAIAGVKAPDSQPLDGVDIRPLFQGENIAPRAIFCHFPGYLQAYERGLWRTAPAGSIIEGDYKLIQFFEDDHIELYNLAEDISEKNNLAKSQPEKARELLDKLIAWRKAVNAPMPKKK